MDKEKVREEAKELMDDFFLELSKIGEKGMIVSKSTESGTRNANDKCRESLDRTQLLKNASKKNDTSILAERKSW